MTEQRIADVLSTVDGVTGYPTVPAAPRPGDAWPVVAQLLRGPGQAWAVEWRVLYVLPVDERVAASVLVDRATALAEALAEVLYVESAAPVEIQTITGAVLGLQIEGVTEV